MITKHIDLHLQHFSGKLSKIKPENYTKENWCEYWGPDISFLSYNTLRDRNRFIPLLGEEVMD